MCFCFINNDMRSVLNFLVVTWKLTESSKTISESINQQLLYFVVGIRWQVTSSAVPPAIRVSLGLRLLVVWMFERGVLWWQVEHFLALSGV